MTPSRLPLRAHRQRRLGTRQRCERLLLVKAFFWVFVVVVVFSSLENYFGFRTTNVRVKTDHSVSLRRNKTF